MMFTTTFRCHRCDQPAVLTAFAEKAGDPKLWDRYRLLAWSQGWVIDLDGVAWCEKHKPVPVEKRHVTRKRLPH